jgi:transcriptional regulator with XRE-family HTH domain
MRSRTALKTKPAADRSVTLTKAALRAAEFLELQQSDVAQIVGVSTATVSRLANGQKLLEPNTKAWQFAALLVRLFRSLDAIVGSDDAAARAWLRSKNEALGGVPIELIRDAAGLVRTVDYLDSARAGI